MIDPLTCILLAAVGSLHMLILGWVIKNLMSLTGAVNTLSTMLVRDNLRINHIEDRLKSGGH